MSKKRPLQSMAIVIGSCWTNFCTQKLKRRTLVTFSYNRTALRATQPKQYSMFCALFLKIISSRADVVWQLRRCDLSQLDYYLWSAVKDKCYADKPEAIDALRTIFVKPVVKYSCTQSIMCLKIGPIVYATAWPAEAVIWMKLFSTIKRKDCTFK